MQALASYGFRLDSHATLEKQCVTTLYKAMWRGSISISDLLDYHPLLSSRRGTDLLLGPGVEFFSCQDPSLAEHVQYQRTILKRKWRSFVLLVCGACALGIKVWVPFEPWPVINVLRSWANRLMDFFTEEYGRQWTNIPSRGESC